MTGKLNPQQVGTVYLETFFDKKRNKDKFINLWL